jgi:hypothetical protein
VVVGDQIPILDSNVEGHSKICEIYGGKEDRWVLASD